MGVQPTPAPRVPEPVPLRPPPEPAAPGAAPAQAVIGNAALRGLLDSGEFVVDLGPGVRFSAAELAAGQIEIGPAGRVVPGLALTHARYDLRSRERRIRLTGHFAIPHVRDSEFTINVDADGRAAFTARAATDLAALGNPTLAVSLDETKNLRATVTIAPADLTPRTLAGRLAVEGGGELTLANGRISGRVAATLAYDRLGDGAVDLAFSEEGRLSGSGHVALTTPFLGGTRADLAVGADGALAGSVTVPGAELARVVPGLVISAGTATVAYRDGVVTGELAGLALAYPGFGAATVDATIARGRFTGAGTFAADIAGFAAAQGTWAFREGALTGSLTLDAAKFPAALPVRSGTITATLGPTGALAFRGTVGVTLGPAGAGELTASYSEAGEVSIGATVQLTVPGLQGAQFTVAYAHGNLEGEADVPIDPALLPGVTGAVRVSFREGRWAGETELSYSADDGKLAGTIRVSVAQTEDGAIAVGGSGDVTAQIAPRLQGTLHATILPEGGVDVSGRIEVTEPLELFPEWRTDRELFRLSKNIPLWAMLVAVIRVRAGIRAGIGPGVFRNIAVEGSYTIGQEGEPSFAISGEMFIPAFVEGYVAFGAGLGLDVLLGSLTGGIEGVASAGIYGAISVVPVLSYTNGDYMIEGTATMAAGARLKLALNAWAEIEALWVTVWDNTWELGEWVANVGPDLGLQAHLAYNFSNPAPPTVEFTTSDIDTESLISAAMPEDGPAPSGAREALQNRAEWQGQLREARAAPVPADLAQQAGTAEPAPAAPSRPPRAAAPADPAPPATEAVAPGSAARTDVQAAATPPPTPEQTISPDQAPPTTQPRYPRPVTLATIDEPAATMPRTRDQQREDLAAACEAVSAVENSVEDTDGLVAYFPRIQHRFGLARIELKASGPRGAGVELEINPVAFNPVSELLRGSGLARDDGLNLETAVQFFSDTLDGVPVGTRMVATLLGPDHPEGSGPSGQTALMAKLGSGTGNELGNYFRGHLLNDRIGGPGVPTNLFPITQQANQLHEREVESYVKKWVNTDRYWVSYTVSVTNEQHDLTHPPGSGLNFVKADLVTRAAVLDTGRAEKTARAITIRSSSRIQDFGTAAQRAGASFDQRTAAVSGSGVRQDEAHYDAALAGHQAESFDEGVTIAQSTRVGGATTYALAPAILTEVAALRARKGRGFRFASITGAVQQVAGVGPGRAAVLERVLRDPGELTDPAFTDGGQISFLNTLAAAIAAAIRAI